jgi:hypothetical protein
MKRILFSIIASILLASAGSARTLNVKYPYVVVLDSAVRGVEMSDSLFYEISRKVIFPVNKYDIPEDSKFRKELLGEILPYFDNGEYVFESMLIRGAASPEGPYGWNCTLSHRRRRALLDLIKEHVNQPIDNSLSVKEVPEDYIYLLLLMKERNDKDYDRVAKVVHKYVDTDQAKLKKVLMAMDGKRLWKRLLKEYFPEMRAARVVLFFRKRYDIDAHKIAAVVVPADTKSDELLSATIPTVPIETNNNMEVRIPRREVLSVKTNLLFDFAYVPGYDRFCPIPNIAIEYYPLHGHFTYGASFDCPWWQHYDDYKFFQVRNYQLEARYYLKDGSVEKVGYGNGAAFTGWYAQAYAHLGLYSVCFDAKRGWEGEGVGGGLGFGYVLPLTKTGHWRLEFGAQLGVFFTKYDPYQYQSVLYPERQDNLYYYKWNNFGNFFKRRQHRFTWLGPTRVGVTLTYDLLYRRRAKKGVSFKSWEVVK